MSFKFEKLRIWQKAMDLGDVIDEMVDDFPKKEMYNLCSQLRRAVDSIALNISEGSILQSDPEFGRFLRYSIRSIAEVVTCLHKANRKGYITNIVFKENYNECFNLMNMTIAFRNTLNLKK